MTEVGFTALSVEMNVKCSTSKASATRTTFNVPEDVVLNGLARAYLHKRHVLVSGSVEHHRRVILLEDLVHARLIADTADLDVDRDVVVGAKQLLAEHVGVVLADVEDDDAARARPSPADGTARCRLTRRRL